MAFHCKVSRFRYVACSSSRSQRYLQGAPLFLGLSAPLFFCFCFLIRQIQVTVNFTTYSREIIPTPPSFPVHCTLDLVYIYLLHDSIRIRTLKLAWQTGLKAPRPSNSITHRQARVVVVLLRCSGYQWTHNTNGHIMVRPTVRVPKKKT